MEVVKLLSESHWTSSCIVTMKKFHDICGGPEEASAVLSHLSETGNARYLSIHKKDFVEVLHMMFCWVMKSLSLGSYIFQVGYANVMPIVFLICCISLFVSSSLFVSGCVVIKNCCRA